uniref:ATPase_AAA_core domain-containing protein n=1 Tax=Strongyloides venezuelensis TaxID=75913 RepID=A0A0K0EVT9_STRVS
MTENEYKELDKMINKLIIDLKSNIPTNCDSGDRTQQTLGLRKLAIKRSLRDHHQEISLVLHTPLELTEEQELAIDEKDKLIHVVVDPLLGNVLKPHQRKGVQLMYDYVGGSKIENNYGCILIDEIDKTLKFITLGWTLLKINSSWKTNVQ